MDVDIDVCSSFDPIKVFPTAVRASIVREQRLTPHPCGVYFQAVGTDPITGLAAVPYDLAEQYGHFKLDFLHLHVYDHFTSHAEVKELIKHEPDWGLLLVPSVVEQLFQVSKHLELLEQLKPRSIIELADALALIRPQKRYLMQRYLAGPKRARPFLYQKELKHDGYAFKKAHAVAYALVIVLQLHLIKAGLKF